MGGRRGCTPFPAFQGRIAGNPGAALVSQPFPQFGIRKRTGSRLPGDPMAVPGDQTINRIPQKPRDQPPDRKNPPHPAQSTRQFQNRVPAQENPAIGLPQQHHRSRARVRMMGKTQPASQLALQWRERDPPPPVHPRDPPHRCRAKRAISIKEQHPRHFARAYAHSPPAPEQIRLWSGDLSSRHGAGGCLHPSDKACGVYWQVIGVLHHLPGLGSEFKSVAFSAS